MHSNDLGKELEEDLSFTNSPPHCPHLLTPLAEFLAQQVKGFM